MSDDLTPRDAFEPEDPWRPLRRLTAARVGLGRSGDALPTRAVLGFNHAHSRARDAVHAALDVDALERACRPESISHVRSLAPDRATYLRRPDLGRRLDQPSRERLEGLKAAPSDIVFVVSDGLSARAIAEHALPFLRYCRPRLAGLTVAPLIVATQARVALSDEIGEILGARLCITMIGERPGLSVADSLGLYMTYAPRVGCLDSERNCISNIHGAGGLSYAQASETLVRLVHEALRRRLTGVMLKDETSQDILVDDRRGND